MNETNDKSTIVPCANCGKLIEEGHLIPVVTEGGMAFDMSVCDDCVDYCIPAVPSSYFTLQLSGQRVRWSVGTCDQCDERFDTLTMLPDATSDKDAPMWLCCYCAARQQGDYTTTQLLLTVLKGDKHMMTIVKEDGTVSIEQVLKSVDYILTEDESHEIIFWDDGSLTIDKVEETDSETDHVRLDQAGLRNLKDFLASALAKVEATQG